MLVLPFTLPDGSSVGISSCGGVAISSGSVRSGVNSMTGNVGGCGGVTSSTGGGTRRSLIGVAGSGVGGKCGCACSNAVIYRTSHP